MVSYAGKFEWHRFFRSLDQCSSQHIYNIYAYECGSKQPIIIKQLMKWIIFYDVKHLIVDTSFNDLVFRKISVINFIIFLLHIWGSTVSSGRNAYFGIQGPRFDSQVANEVTNEIFHANGICSLMQDDLNYQICSIIG